jgi:hypothetical protein
LVDQKEWARAVSSSVSTEKPKVEVGDNAVVSAGNRAAPSSIQRDGLEDVLLYFLAVSGSHDSIVFHRWTACWATQHEGNLANQEKDQAPKLEIGNGQNQKLRWHPTVMLSQLAQWPYTPCRDLTGPDLYATCPTADPKNPSCSGPIAGKFVV